MTGYLKICVFAALAFIGSGAISSPSKPTVSRNAGAPGEFSRLYNSIRFNEGERPDSSMFSLGLLGYYHLKASKRLSSREIITLIDFSRPSTEKRMWVIDLEAQKVLYHTLVAHGRNSGELYASKFSNQPNSNQSSVGFFVTGNIYTGKNGTSMKLYGMEKGVNDLADSRAIVMHGASYVSDAFVKKAGRLGRSHGCPAVPMEVHREVIDLLANGTCLFIYYPTEEIKASAQLNLLAGSN